MLSSLFREFNDGTAIKQFHSKMAWIVSKETKRINKRSKMYCASYEVRTEFLCYVEGSRPPLWSSGQSSWLHNGDVLCFLWSKNWIYVCYVEKDRPPLWSSGQSSWLQIERSGFDFRRYQIFWEVVGLEWGPLSLVSTTEELFETKSSGSGLEIRDYSIRDSSRWPRGTLYP
jgi:hypothetical protein